MILPGFPVMLGAAAGFEPGPIITMGAVDLNPSFTGYMRPGGIVAGLFGLSGGGSISATIMPGFVTDAVFYYSGAIEVYLVGDARPII
ncbi:MAG: hypothetical protein ABJI65_20595, partial [Tateyamaria sp.]